MPCGCWMPVSSRSAILLAATLLGTGAVRAWSQAAPGTGVAGTYRRVGAASVALEVAAHDDRLQVVLTGGGPPASDGSVPADCMVKAAGHLQGRSLTAVFEAVATADFAYGQAKAAAERRRLVIVFSPGVAEVERADTFGYCGLGITFLGEYRRANQETIRTMLRR